MTKATDLFLPAQFLLSRDLHACDECCPRSMSSKFSIPRWKVSEESEIKYSLVRADFRLLYHNATVQLLN